MPAIERLEALRHDLIERIRRTDERGEKVVDQDDKDLWRRVINAVNGE